MLPIKKMIENYSGYLISMITALGYLCVYSFELGFCAAFDIPTAFITFDIQIIFRACFVFFAVFFLIAIVIGFIYVIDPNYRKKPILVAIPVILIFATIIFFNLPKFQAYQFVIIYFLIIMPIWAIGSFIMYFWNEDLPFISTVTKHIATKQPGIFNRLLIFSYSILVIALPIGSYKLSNYLALHPQQFTTIGTTKILLLKKYDDLLIGRVVHESNTLSDSLYILKLSEIPNLKLEPLYEDTLAYKGKIIVKRKEL